jgi:Fe-S cluster assembly protein SufD
VSAVAQPIAGRAPEAYTRDFESLLAATPRQPAWVHELRRAALERFTALGFPTTKNEDWHYTSVAPIAESEFMALTAPGGDVSADEVPRYTFGDGGSRVVFLNGRFAAELSAIGTLPRGAHVVPLADAWSRMPELLRRHLGRIAKFEDAAFTALNTAHIVDGLVVHLEKDVVLEKPIQIIHVTDAMAARGIAQPRVLIVAERNSRGTVMESFVATGDAHYFTNAVTEICLDEGATLTHLKLQQESQRAFHVATVEATQAKDSHFFSFSFGTGADLSRTNIYTHLNGEGCGATLNGLYVLDRDQHMDHQTSIEHVAPNCYSRELYKGILDGTSHGVFNGKVYVHPEAQKTDGKQTNNTLLLSEKAQIDTKPQLEIFADDVKCTHGATIGRLDETALFYMKSRGIGAVHARELLTYAFAADVLETIEVDAVREGLEQLTLMRYTHVEEERAGEQA